MLSCVQLFVTPWTIAHQAPLSKGFSKQEYWSRLPFPPLEDLPHPGIKLTSPAAPSLACKFFTTEYLGSPCLLLWEAFKTKWTLLDCVKSQIWESTVYSFIGVKWLDIIAYQWLMSWTDHSAPDSQMFLVLALFHPSSFSYYPSFYPSFLCLFSLSHSDCQNGLSQLFNKKIYWVTQLSVIHCKAWGFCLQLLFTWALSNGNPLQYFCLENPMDGGAW